MMIRKYSVMALLLSVLSLSPVAAWAGGHGGGEGGAEAEVAGAQFLPIGPITVPIIKDGKIFQYVTFTVKLEVEDAASAEMIKDRQPILNDAYISNLYGTFYVGNTLQAGQIVDVEKLRNKLEQANKRVLGENVVKNTYIQGLSQHGR